MTPTDAQTRLCRFRDNDLKREQSARRTGHTDAARDRQADAEALAIGILAFERLAEIEVALSGEPPTAALVRALRAIGDGLHTARDIRSLACWEAADRLEAVSGVKPAPQKPVSSHS